MPSRPSGAAIVDNSYNFGDQIASPTDSTRTKATAPLNDSHKDRQKMDRPERNALLLSKHRHSGLRVYVFK